MRESVVDAHKHLADALFKFRFRLLAFEENHPFDPAVAEIQGAPPDSSCKTEESDRLSVLECERDDRTQPAY